MAIIRLWSGLAALAMIGGYIGSGMLLIVALGMLSGYHGDGLFPIRGWVFLGLSIAAASISYLQWKIPTYFVERDYWGPINKLRPKGFTTTVEFIDNGRLDYLAFDAKKREVIIYSKKNNIATVENFDIIRQWEYSRQPTGRNIFSITFWFNSLDIPRLKLCICGKNTLKLVDNFEYIMGLSGSAPIEPAPWAKPATT